MITDLAIMAIVCVVLGLVLMTLFLAGSALISWAIHGWGQFRGKK